MGAVFLNLFIGVTLCSIMAAIIGCVHNNHKEEEEGMDENLTPSLTPFQTDSTVSPAPKQLFLHLNSSETLQSQGNNLTIPYLFPSLHLVEVTTDGDIETIGIKRSTRCPGNHCGYYATKDDIDYSIKPVVWIYSEGIWSFETWNGSELFFEIHIMNK